MGGSLTMNTPGANGGLEVPRTCSGKNNSVGDNIDSNNTTSGREKTDTSALHLTNNIYLLWR